MRYLVWDIPLVESMERQVSVRDSEDCFTSFPAEVGNPNYDSFLESQDLTDAQVQAMEPDVWHDMA